MFGLLTCSACHYGESDAGERLSFEADAGDVCFDAQLEAWIENFQQNQQNGMDMFSADKSARKAAIMAYEDCRNRNAYIRTSDQARKD